MVYKSTFYLLTYLHMEGAVPEKAQWYTGWAKLSDTTLHFCL